MSNVDKIKERLKIEDVVSRYVKLERSGSSFKARCPFHNEKTPSFFVSPDRGTYHCFGCSVGGDIFSFVQEFEKVDFKGALKILADFAGIILENDFGDKKTTDDKERILEALEDATKFYEKNIVGRKDVLEYLKKRGLEEATIKEWRVGYAPLEWRDLSEYLLKKNYSIKDLERAGLSKKTEKGFYDRFRGRIMFPLFDLSGRVIAFSGRFFEGDALESAKYINSPETEVFVKSKVLYGLHKAKQYIRKMNLSILVEGQMDVIMAHQAGFPYTVAGSGTALTDDHLDILHRWSENIILAYDADGAGFKASERAWQKALSIGMEIKIATLPKGMDPADCVLKDKNILKDALKNSKHIIDIKIDEALNIGDKKNIAKSIRANTLPYISELPSRVMQSHYVSEISLKSGIAESALWDDLQTLFKSKTLNQPVGKLDKKDEASSGIRQRLLGILTWQESAKDNLVNAPKIKKEISDFLGDKDWEKDFPDNPKEIEKVVWEAERHYGGSKDLAKDVEELKGRFLTEEVRERLSRAGGDPGLVSDLLSKKKKLDKNRL